MSNTTLTIVIVIVVVAVVAIAGIVVKIAQKKRSERLREQFGPEYERAVKRSDSPREAESELRERTKRHKQLELRDLSRDERAGFERQWTEVQGQFVDDPSQAVRSADQLVVAVMSARGYPVDDFDRRADDLSVSHPEVTQRYREARVVSRANDEGSASTEDLRKAVTSYRALVKALLSDGAGAEKGTDRRRTDADDADRAESGRPDTGRADMGRGERDAEPAAAGESGHTNGHAREDRTTARETEPERETH